MVFQRFEYKENGEVFSLFALYDQNGFSTGFMQELHGNHKVGTVFAVEKIKVRIKEDKSFVVEKVKVGKPIITEMPKIAVAASVSKTK
jgi:hypothetical protein